MVWKQVQKDQLTYLRAQQLANVWPETRQKN